MVFSLAIIKASKAGSIKTDVIYETPNYKVWVGTYYTQLEADKRLLEISFLLKYD